MQVVFGECALDVGDMPSKEAAVSSMKDDKSTNGKSIPPPPEEGDDGSESGRKGKEKRV